MIGDREPAVRTGSLEFQFDASPQSAEHEADRQAAFGDLVDADYLELSAPPAHRNIRMRKRSCGEPLPPGE